MSTRRLQLALEKLESSDWARFERLASAFLAADFDDMRTVASPAGDDGRDSDLFSPKREPNVLLQYSVSSDWQGKIQRTANRITETFPEATVLIYLSNHTIGAKADPIRRKLRQEYGLALDVRDQNWFLERVLGSAACEKAAEELARVIVDPLLSAAGITSYPPSELSAPESIAALTFLELQWRDDIREKGLTKIAFEALVRSALANTDSTNRMARRAVHEAILRILPGHSVTVVTQYIDSALKRLTKRAVRHWQKDDEFCLTHDELQRVNDYKTEAVLAESALLEAIYLISHEVLGGDDSLRAHEDALSKTIRVATDAVIFDRSQTFAMAVQNEAISKALDADFTDVLIRVLSRHPLPRIRGVDWVDALRCGVREVLLSDDLAVQTHIRSLADAYTLLAFLRQTPDVQSAVEKMFSHGQIWLDASVVLPLFAEPLFDGPPGRFTRMIIAARNAGLELYITPGIVEEVERHMNLAFACNRSDHASWVGSVPYLLEQYLASGHPSSAFTFWLENFRGRYRPEQDVADYLNEEFGIRERGLEQERNDAPPELRHALEGIWYDVHKSRRERREMPIDEATITRLVNHDLECYCGVVQLRRRERASSIGYSAWWLTVDHMAFDLKQRLRELMSSEPPDSPVLSADFMVNYLAFGPVRRNVDKEQEAHLPILMELENARYLTPEIMTEADRLRDQMRDLPERVVRRKIRDRLDCARRRLGPIAKAGFRDLDDELG